jgi:hypothetical protein
VAEAWFRPKRIGYGLTPIAWPGWALTFLLVAVLSASICLITYLIRDPFDAVVSVLVVVSAEVSVFILFSYRRAKSFDDYERDAAALVEKKRDQTRKDLEEWNKNNG